MYDQEKITPYDAQGDKGKLVEAMFDHIAPTYDKLNHRLSWNIDRSWRKETLSRVLSFSPRTILDIATGTGDFALLAAKMLKPDNIIGADISEGMMSVGRQKAAEAGLDGLISFQKEDCFNLSFEDNSFDLTTAAFGIRNFKDLDRCLAELYRVLRPGGHAAIVELSHPQRFPMKQLFGLYAHTFLPAYAKLVSKDRGAYQYLIKTIEAFPQGEEMVGILKKAGFSEVEFKRMTFGICTYYIATK